MTNQFQSNPQYQPVMYGQPQSPMQPMQYNPAPYMQQNLQATQQRYAQMQQMQPQQQYPQQFAQQPQYQAQALMGHFVQDENEVIAGKVPMDSNVMYFFPRIDGSCIYGAFWTPNGKFKTVQFNQVPENSSQSTEETTSVTDKIMEELKEIKTMIADTAQPSNTRGSSTRSTKKGNDNGNAQL